MPRPTQGPRLKLNKRGIYEIRWIEGRNVKRLSTRTANVSEAQRFFAGWILEQDRQTVGAWDANQALDYYTAERLDAGKTADPANDKARMPHLRKHFGDWLVPDIDVEHANKYVKMRTTGKLGRKVVESTVRRELSVLVAAFNFCADSKKIKKEHVPNIPLPAESAPLDHWLTNEELDLAMDVAQPAGAKRLTRVYRFVALGRYTAARRRAIQGLDWFRTDLARDMIDYRKPGERQTKKRRGLVPIANELKPILQRALRERMKDGDTLSAYVLDHPGEIGKSFDTLMRQSARRASAIAAELEAAGEHEKAVRYAAMAPRFLKSTPHTLRHSWATLAAQRGVPLYDIAGVLHDTMTTVEKRYAHHCPNHLRSAVNAAPVTTLQPKGEQA